MAAFTHSQLCINLMTGSFPPLTSTYKTTTTKNQTKQNKEHSSFRSLMDKKMHSIFKKANVETMSASSVTIRLIGRKERKPNRLIKTKINEHSHHSMYRTHLVIKIALFSDRSLLQKVLKIEYVQY